MLLAAIVDLLDQQDGVVSRGQLLAEGARPCDIERWLRRRDLCRVLPGVFVTHTGTLTWHQRAWAAVLWAGRGGRPAALAWTSAVRAAGGRSTRLPGDTGDIVHVLIGPGRQLRPPRWIRVHGCRAIHEMVVWAGSPPRQREEEAALDIAIAQLQHRSSWAHLNAAGALSEPIQARRTTADRLQAALDGRERVAHRRWISGVVADVAAGATSVLERGYLTLVERPHGLPPALRQVVHQTPSGTVIRDALLLNRQIVELDGFAFHSDARTRDGDLERDLDAASTGLDTVRLGWGQIFDRPCATAGKVAALLATHGWAETPRPCSPACPAAA